MNRKRRRERFSVLYLLEDGDMLYPVRRYRLDPEPVPFKTWVRRLDRLSEHNKAAALEMFEARFGRPKPVHSFYLIEQIRRMHRYLRWRNKYRNTGEWRME